MGFVRLAGVAATLMAGAPAVKAVGADPRLAPPIDFAIAEAVITLERTSRLGSCPVYTVEIRGDGTVLYNGEDHVHLRGSHTAHVTEAQFLDLLDRSYRVRFPDLEDE